MAQLFAVLYSQPKPLHTDELMEALSVSRGNANMNLHKLLDWKLIRKVHLPNDRKDYYESEADVWQFTLNIIRHRQELELKPVRERADRIVETLVNYSGGLPSDEQQEAMFFTGRLSNLIQFIDLFFEFTALALPLLEKQDAAQLKAMMGFLRSFQSAEDAPTSHSDTEDSQ